MIDLIDLDSVLRNDTCAGCGACAAVDSRISMKLNDDGFLRPALDSQPVSIHSRNTMKLEAFCPGLKLDASDLPENRDIVWGAIETKTLAYATDNNLRKKGSSGGVLSALTRFLLEDQDVDYVLNTVAGGEVFDNVSQLLTCDGDDTMPAGSRYGPSSPCELLGEVALLPVGKTVAFIGKPCDVAAARKLCDMDPRLKAKVKYFLSFMCAGVPSIQATHDVVQALGLALSEVVSFRYRGDGWPGLARAVTVNGSEKTMTYQESWGSILNKKLQHRCKICIDGIGEYADIVCGDGWACDEHGYPIFEEAAGVSLVFTRTPIGTSLMNKAISKGYLAHVVSEIEELQKIQPFQYYRRISIFSRVLAMILMMKSPSRYENFSMLKLALRAGIKMNLSAFFGMIVRRKKILKRSLWC